MKAAPPFWALLAVLSVGMPHLLVAQPTHAPSTKGTQPGARKPLSQSLSGPAKADFEAGKLLATDGDFAGALIKFQNAYEISKDPRLLWNVAFCHKNLRHYAKVLATLKRYIEEGGQALGPSDRKEAQDLIELIEPFTTRATFTVSESGAAMYVDDELVGSSPLSAPVVLDIGERRLRVVKEGFRNFERTLAIGGAREVTVEVALERDVHEGKLIVNAPPGATIFLDDRAVGTGKLDQSLVSGGHQIRVTAPGMHTFQTEVVIRDKETRSVEVSLEALAPAEKPRLRVAVGCSTADPKAPEDGLVVYLDGPEVLPPASVKRKWSEEQGTDVLEWVEYSVSPGPHQVRVSITDCRASDVMVNVDPQKGAGISGALESDRFVLFRGPLGSPGWFRLGLGLWMPGSAVRDEVPERYGGKVGKIVGGSLEVGFMSRWFSAHLQAAAGRGAFHRDTHDTHYALPSSATVTWSQWSVRFGPRFPFNLLALGLGPSLGMQELDVHRVRTGKPSAIFGVFGQLDIQPFCDFGLSVMGKVDKPSNDDEAVGALHVGLYYQPNGKCRRERATRTGLNPS
jgi:hypothetical protein